MDEVRAFIEVRPRFQTGLWIELGLTATEPASSVPLSQKYASLTFGIRLDMSQHESIVVSAYVARLAVKNSGREF